MLVLLYSDPFAISSSTLEEKKMSYKHFSSTSHDFKRCGGNESLLMFCCHEEMGLEEFIFVLSPRECLEYLSK
jgi:hypothetical protein